MRQYGSKNADSLCFGLCLTPPQETSPRLIQSRFHAKHHAIITYTVPPSRLEKFLHSRYTCSVYKTEKAEEWAFLSLVISSCAPKQNSKIQQWLDPGPFSCINYRSLVQDMVFWQRSSWQFGTCLNSLFYRRIPRAVYGLPLFHSDVKIDAEFNESKQRYLRYEVQATSDQNIGNLRLSVKDTGKPLLESPLFEGFDNNESMLGALAFPGEYVTRGEGNWVYRQIVQSTPFHPTVGTLCELPHIPFFTKQFGLSDLDLANPHSILLQQEIENLQALTLESHVEDDNEPNSASQTYGINDRIQRRAMNRNFRFRDEIREKAYRALEENQDLSTQNPSRVRSSLDQTSETSWGFSSMAREDLTRFT